MEKRILTRIRHTFKPDKKQKPLDFEGPKSLKEWKRRIRNRIVSKAKLPAHLKRMLTRLDWYCMDKTYCWPSLRQLATDLGYQWPKAKRTLIYQIGELRRLGLIRTEPLIRPNGSNGVNKYRLLYGRIQATAGDRKAEIPEPPPGEAHFTTQVKLFHHPGETDFTTQVKPVSPLETNMKRMEGNTTAPLPPEPTWEMATAALSEFGIERVNAAATEARSAGLTPAQLLALIETANSARKVITPGMLYDRIRNARPNLEARAGWHPTAQAALSQTASREAARRAAAANATREATRAAARAKESERLACLTERYGPIIDAMNADEFSALMNAANLTNYARQSAQKNRRAKLTLPALLEELEKLYPIESTALVPVPTG